MGGFDPAFVASGAGHRGGSVPDPGGTTGTAHFLREDSTWAAPYGGAFEAYRTTDALPPATTWTDLLTITPAAGSYAVIGQADVGQSEGEGGFGLRIVAGSTVVSGAEGNTPATGAVSCATAPRIVSVDGATGITLQINCAVAGNIVHYQATAGGASPATTLVAWWVGPP